MTFGSSELVNFFQRKENIYERKTSAGKLRTISTFSEALQEKPNTKMQLCTKKKKKTKVSFHCIQNNLFKPRAKPEIYHAKMFLAQAEKLIPDLVLIGTGQSNTQTREMLAVTPGSSFQVLLAGFIQDAVPIKYSAFAPE